MIRPLGALGLLSACALLMVVVVGAGASAWQLAGVAAVIRAIGWAAGRLGP